MVDMCVGRLALEWVVLCFADRSCSIEALCTLAHRCNSMYSMYIGTLKAGSRAPDVKHTIVMPWPRMHGRNIKNNDLVVVLGTYIRSR